MSVARRALSKVWRVQHMVDGPTGQSFKKNILLYPETGGLREYDPWLIGAEDWMKTPGNGFEDHPHRGFETITIILEGRLKHTDKSAGRRGNQAVLEAGDVQWITTGKGVIHAEMPEGKDVCHVLQIWLNLPSKHKAEPSAHQELRNADIARVKGDGSLVRVVAGSHAGVTASTTTYIPVTVLDVTVQPGASSITVSVPASHRGWAYVYQGDETSVNSETGATGGAAVVSGKRVEAGQAAWFEDLRGSSVTEQTEVTIEPAAGATKAARVFVFHGLPIGEPVVSHGPFVMNTQAEIAQAFADYRAGKF